MRNVTLPQLRDQLVLKIHTEHATKAVGRKFTNFQFFNKDKTFKTFKISKCICKHNHFIKLKLIIIKINGHFSLSNIDKFVFKKTFK